MMERKDPLICTLSSARTSIPINHGVVSVDIGITSHGAHHIARQKPEAKTPQESHKKHRNEHKAHHNNHCTQTDA